MSGEFAEATISRRPIQESLKKIAVDSDLVVDLNAFHQQNNLSLLGVRGKLAGCDLKFRFKVYSLGLLLEPAVDTPVEPIVAQMMNFRDGFDLDEAFGAYSPKLPTELGKRPTDED